jgi:hypothetical protein
MTRIRIALVAVLLAACQEKVDPQVVALVGSDRINRGVEMAHIVPQPVDPALEGEYEVFVTNQSQDRYIFPIDFGAQLLVYSERTDEWREVDNFITYLPADGSIVLEPRSEWPDNEHLFSVRPVLERREDDTRLRIVIVGQDEFGEVVGAYLDIPLSD